MPRLERYADQITPLLLLRRNRIKADPSRVKKLFTVSSIRIRRSCRYLFDNFI